MLVNWVFLCRFNVSATRALVFTPTRLSFAFLPFVCGPQPHSIKLWLFFDGSAVLFLSLTLSLSSIPLLPFFCLPSCNSQSQPLQQDRKWKQWRTKVKRKQFCSYWMVSQKRAAFFYVYDKDSFSVPGLFPLRPIFREKNTWGLLKMGKNVLLIRASIRKMCQKPPPLLYEIESLNFNLNGNTLKS